MYKANSVDLPIKVAQAEGKLRLWRNTSLDSSGQRKHRDAGTAHSRLRVRRGPRQRLPPGGLITMSTTTGPTPEYLTDFGNTVVPGHHHPPCHALQGGQWGAGVLRWNHPVGMGSGQPTMTVTGQPADQRIQQATVNILADMDAPPRLSHPA